MPITPLDPLPPIDLSPEDLIGGETTTFVDKTNTKADKIQTYFDTTRTWSLAFATFLQDHQDALDAMQAQVDAATQDNATASQQITDSLQGQLNLLPDHGAFLIDDPAFKDNPNLIYTDNTSVFSNRAFTRMFRDYNGSDHASAYNQATAYTDSSTYGGLEPAINVNATFVIDAMGGANRYFRPFSVLRTTAGDGVSGESYNGTHFPMLLSRALALTGSGSYSFSTYYRNVGTGAPRSYLKNPPYSSNNALYINGVRAPDDDGYTEFGTGIKHIAVSHVSPDGQMINDDAFNMLVLPNSAHHWACMRLAAGAFQLKPNNWAISSYPVHD